MFVYYSVCSHVICLVSVTQFSVSSHWLSSLSPNSSLFLPDQFMQVVRDEDGASVQRALWPLHAEHPGHRQSRQATWRHSRPQRPDGCTHVSHREAHVNRNYNVDPIDPPRSSSCTYVCKLPLSRKELVYLFLIMYRCIYNKNIIWPRTYQYHPPLYSVISLWKYYKHEMRAYYFVQQYLKKL